MELRGRKLQQSKSPLELVDDVIDESVDHGPMDLDMRDLQALPVSAAPKDSSSTRASADPSTIEAFLVSHWLVAEGEG